MGGSTKTTTKTKPSALTAPFVTSNLNNLQTAQQTGNAVTAALQPKVDALTNQTFDMAATKPQYLTDSEGQLDKTINGGYLNNNPYIDQIAQQTGDQAQAGYNSTFGASGNAGSGLAALLSSQGVANAIAQSRYGEYNDERTLQQQAIGAAPAFYQGDFAGVNPAIAAANADNTLPVQNAVNTSNAMVGATNPYITTTQKQSGGGLGQIIGGALSLGLAPFTGGASLAGLGGLLAGGGGTGMTGLPASLAGMNGAVNGVSNMNLRLGG